MVSFSEELICRITKENFEICVEFFIVFSRFESILKEFLYINKDKVDWDKFISEEKQNIINLEKNKTVEDSYTFLVENPPKKQIIKDWILVWKKVDETWDDIFLTSRYIWRVRNNLFH